MSTNPELSQFAQDRARAYTKLFDDFVKERGLDWDEEDWSKDDLLDFADLCDKQDEIWDALAENQS